MRLPRGSGILLHPSSLPGPWGIGDLGPEAHRFVRFLAAAGQRYWQMLPLGPTGYGDSPYAAPSAFAGNPMLISPDALVEEGWLEREDLAGRPGGEADRVDYGAVIPWKKALLWKAFARFEARRGDRLPEEIEAFYVMASGWLEDLALFLALKEAHGGEPWHKWETGARLRDPRAIALNREEFAPQIRYQRFVQYLFFRQLTALKQAANEAGIALIGDMPIFVADDSADVWAHRELFLLTRTGRPRAVAGVPPDYFSKKGQVWGNPLYDWNAMRQTGYAWWVARMRMALTMADIVRIDHFRGFAAAWAIPAGDKTAVRGQWVDSPGLELFATLTAQLGTLPVIAEDLGVITPDVEELRDRFAFPGMKVLQFAFGGDRTNPYLPANHVRNCVVYPGTHDNDTTVGWYRTAKRKEKLGLLRHTGTDGSRPALDMIRLALASPADLAILPMQDLLELGTRARMNVPGVASGNWRWRLTGSELTHELAAGLKSFVREFAR